MKKFLLMAVVAFGMLATACSKDEVAQPVVGGEESIATFTVEAPVMATRYGEGTTATQLSWAVYDKTHNLLFQSTEAIVMSGLKATVEIPFVNGMAYNILFWAESANSPYSVNWAEKSVAYKNASQLANDENYDAFFCYFTELDAVTGPVNEDVELKRPFAQLRIATNDTADAEKSGITVTDTKVTVAKTYTAFDFVAGDVKGETSTVEFAYNNAAKKAVGQIVVGGNTYDLLTVNYLFGYKGDKKLVDAKLTYKYGGNEVSADFSSVPIQQNYRTNIIGSLLTSDGVFNVEIEEGFADEEYTADENGNLYIPGTSIYLVKAAKKEDGGVIYLNSADDFKYLQTLWNDWNALTGGQQHYAYRFSWDVVLKAGVDIDLEGAVWTPLAIGFKNYNFNGNTIKNFVVDVAGDAGLFGMIYDINEAKSGTLENLNIVNANIKGERAGVIAGHITGTIKNCTVTNSVVEASKYAGGIVGHGYASFIGNEISSTSVTSHYKDAGGLVGFNCSTQSITGNTVENSVTVQMAADAQASNIGALVGRWNFPQGESTPGIPVVGNNTNNTAYPLIGAAVNGTIPTNVAGTTIMLLTASVKEDGGVIYLNSADDFKYLQTLWNDWNALTGGQQHYAYRFSWDVVLKAGVDIDLEGAVWTPLAIGFKNYNFNGNTIKNFVVDVAGDAGLFGMIYDINEAKSGTLENLNIVNANIKGERAGVIAGHITGTIKNCTVTNSVVEASKYAGGIVGHGYASFIGNEISSTSVTSHYKDAGGLVGFNCSTQSITGNTVENSVTVQMAADAQASNIGALVGRWNFPQGESTPGTSVLSGNINNTAYALIGAAANGTMPQQN